MSKEINKCYHVLMVCHGNICRSPMAEFVLKDMVNKSGCADLFYIASAATSTEEIGNPVHRGTKSILREHGINAEGKRAVQLTRQDYEKYDYLIGMDQRNISNMIRILGGDPGKKVFRLLDLTKKPRDISDPWYTGDFETTYDDVYEGCAALLEMIMSSRKRV